MGKKKPAKKTRKKNAPPRPGVVRKDGKRTEKPKSKNPVVQRMEVDGEIYQLEYTRCGSVGCHCMKGSKGHGPYWYAYAPNPKTGAWRGRYVGAELDTAKAKRRARRK